MNSAKLGFVIFQVSQLCGGEGVTKGIWTMTKDIPWMHASPSYPSYLPTVFCSKEGIAAQAASLLFPHFSQLKHLLSISCTQHP